MAAYIDLKYGEGTAASLRAQAKIKVRHTRQWLEQKIACYKVLIGEASEPGERPRDPEQSHPQLPGTDPHPPKGNP
jgi:hypothetical protein